VISKAPVSVNIPSLRDNDFSISSDGDKFFRIILFIPDLIVITAKAFKK
jgi:hypothetical protein